MYHQIARNKRNSVVVTVGFVIVWLAVGATLGGVAGYVWDVSGQAIGAPSSTTTRDAIIGVIIFGLLSVGAALYAYYFGAAAVLNTMDAQEADPTEHEQLYDTVQSLAVGDGLPMPKVYVMYDPSPNAFATGRDSAHSALVVTTGLVQMMSREELEGVLAHEMSHIRNYDVRLLLVVTTMIGSLVLLSQFFWSVVKGSVLEAIFYLPLTLFLSLVAVVVGPLMQLSLSRQREWLADASGVELTRNPQGLISALEKIMQNSRPPQRFNHAVAAMMIDNPPEHHGGIFSKLFDTHPPIAARIAALQRITGVQQS